MPPVAPRPGESLGVVRDFKLQKFLGKGTFGAVYTAVRQGDGQVYALKKVDTRNMSLKERQEAVNEIRILASVAGPHVIKFLEAFVENNVLYIITEFAPNGDMFAWLKRAKSKGPLPEDTVWSLFIQMCLGIASLHEKSILHRDLKGANVFMMSNKYLKLGDFGVSKVLKSADSLARTQVGTPYYVAPEVWRNRPYNGKCDMWSVGCLLYELLMFRPPFEANSMEGLARKVMRGKFDPIPRHYSQDMHTIVNLLLVVDPVARPSVQDILSHPIIQRHMAVLPPQSELDDSSNQEVDLINTIHVPRRFNDLTKNLPPSRYETPNPSRAGSPKQDGGRVRVNDPQLVGGLAKLEPLIEGPDDLKLPVVVHAQNKPPAQGIIYKPPGAGMPPGAHLPHIHHGRNPSRNGRDGAVTPSVYNYNHRKPPSRSNSKGSIYSARSVYAPQNKPPSREIRVVSHMPTGSKVSIIHSSNDSSYNPINHQPTPNRIFRNHSHNHYHGVHARVRHQPRQVMAGGGGQDRWY